MPIIEQRVNIREPVIVVVAGSIQEAAFWVDSNVIPVATHAGIERLRGLSVEGLYFVGRWHLWAGKEEVTELNALAKGR